MKLYRPVGAKTLWPIGSLYLSVNSTSPQTLFGGTWTQISNRFLYCVTSGAKGTGGSNTINLQHRHDFKIGFPFDYGEILGDNLDSDYYGAYAYSISKYGKSRSNSEISSLTVFRNGNHVQTGSSNDWGRVASSTGDTDTALSASQSIMPAYIKIYAWYRTA